MAKKVGAALQKKQGRVVARCIKMVRSEKTGAYVFREEMVNVEREKEFFAD